MLNLNLRILVVIVLITFLNSCIKENKIILRYSFETSPPSGWSNVNLKKGKGHNGKNFTYADSASMYSAGFSRKLSNISDKKVKRIDIVSWIRKIQEYSSADFVISLEKNGSYVFWNSVSTNTAYPTTNEWTRMYCSYDIPDSIGHDEELKVYLWNKSPIAMEADDFEIRLYY